MLTHLFIPYPYFRDDFFFFFAFDKSSRTVKGGREKSITMGTEVPLTGFHILAILHLLVL